MSGSALASNERSHLRERSAVKRSLSMLRRNWLGMLGIGVLAAAMISAIFAPVIAPHDPHAGDVTARLICPLFTTCEPYIADGETVPGTTEHILGTDQLGRDILSRIIFGARVSLIVGITAVLFASTMGVGLGLLTGYYGGRIDSIVMRIADVFLAFPFLLLAIALVAVIGGGLVNVIIVLAIANWVPYARLMRGSVLSAKNQEYVVAARTIGARDSSILVKHLLPNCITPIIVFGTFAVAAVIIAEAGLSFLGLGVGPAMPTWGSMLSDGRAYVDTAWWLATFPGLALLITAFSINVTGDWIRDSLDPHLRNT